MIIWERKNKVTEGNTIEMDLPHSNQSTEGMIKEIGQIVFGEIDFVQVRPLTLGQRYRRKNIGAARG